MARSTAEIELVALVGEANKTVKKFASDTQKQLSSISFASTVSAINAGFELVGKTAGRAFGAIADFAGDAIEASARQEEAINSLNSSLALAGSFSEEASRKIQDFATEIQRTTTVSDDAVINLVALSRNFTRTNEEAVKLTEAAINLSAATGISLEGAVKNLGKTYSGLTGELGESLPIIKTLTAEQLKAGAALDLILTRFGGAAANQVNTFNGALQQLNNQFDDFNKSIGQSFTNNQVVVEVLKAIGNELANLTKIIKENQPLIREFVNNFIIQIIENGQRLVDVLTFVAKVFSFIGTAIDQAAKSLAAFAAGTIELLKGNYAAALEIATARIEDFKQGFIDLETSFRRNERIGRSVNKFLSNVADNAREASKEVSELAKVSNVTGGAGLTPQINKDEFKKRLEELSKDPVKIFFTPELTKKLELDISDATKAGIASATGFLNTLLKGSQGAVSIFQSLAANFADALIPGIGGAVGEIVGVLSKGPEEVRKLVSSFIQAIPQILVNIVKAIPALIEELIRNIPLFIQALIAAIPELINAIIQAIPQIIISIIQAIPQIIFAFVNGIITNIPHIIYEFTVGILNAAYEFGKAILEFINPFSEDGLVGSIPIVGDVVGFVGDIFSGVGDFLGFAEGGRVPDRPAFEGDRFPARLNAGEQVLSKDLSSQLEDFLSGGSSQPVVVNLVVGQQQLARAIFEINRGGFRTS